MSPFPLRNRRSDRARLGAPARVLLLGLGTWLAGPVLPAQAPTPDPERLERLRRDQEELLRKAERLQGLMQRLLERYRRDGKAETRLLEEGLAHLERSGVLQEVAGIRDDLAATALSEAARKQREVIAGLERLLDILLERQSAQELDQQRQQAERQAMTARQLEQRQRELKATTEQLARGDQSQAERELVEALQQLARQQAGEAQQNRSDAGTRRPFLEAALERTEQLLAAQDRLEQALRDEANGAPAADRARQFDLGNLAQRTRELLSQVRGQARQDELAKAAEALQRAAAGTDQQALQQARDQLQALLQDPPKRRGGSEGPRADGEWQALRDQLQKLRQGNTEAERNELGKLAAAAGELAGKRQQEDRQQNQRDAATLAKDAGALAAQQPKTAPNGQPNPVPESLATAQRQLEAAGASAQQGDTNQAQQQLAEAQAALDRARQQDSEQHPDAERLAAAMAASAATAAQELRTAPAAAEAERKAAAALQQAEQQLRAAAEQLARHEAGAPRQAATPNAEAARPALQQAAEQLRAELQSATADRGPELAAAARRQQELQRTAEAVRQQLAGKQQEGAMAPAQADPANRQIEQAQQAMQAAEQQLGQGQQASAAERQQQAAEALQRAAERLQQNRPRQANTTESLHQQAAAQQQLEEEIARLAAELKERDAKDAQRATEQAEQAARRARQALEQGDTDTAEQQQERAAEKLEEAAEQLEEERDRYQDLRQEELLFKMKEELTAFLAKQEPLSRATLEAQQLAAREALSRAQKRQLNQIGEEELELQKRIQFLVDALDEDGNLVYQAVLRATVDDLGTLGERLGGRNPDPGRFTTLLQADVTRRAQDLLAALERERQRREQERKEQQQQQQQPKSQNRFNPQREKLVSLIAELEMLKRLEQDTARATQEQQVLVGARDDEQISETEVALIERLSHRHAEISTLFLRIKTGIEETLQAMQGEGGDPTEPQPNETNPRERRRGR
ncbi:MAG: hypothetical protein JNK49_16660 [Planctomycetes bacterium]|nr:hypothetical protein [Planctomycetota bacterium]